MSKAPKQKSYQFTRLHPPLLKVEGEGVFHVPLASRMEAVGERASWIHYYTTENETPAGIPFPLRRYYQETFEAQRFLHWR